MDAMSDAVKGAEVVLYGVSRGYKESANCRLEANYAHQQGQACPSSVVPPLASADMDALVSVWTWSR